MYGKYVANIIFVNRVSIQIGDGSYEKCISAVEGHIKMLTEYERSSRNQKNFEFDVRQPMPGFRWELYIPVVTKYRTYANMRCMFSVEGIAK